MPFAVEMATIEHEEPQRLATPGTISIATKQTHPSNLSYRMSFYGLCY